MSKTYAALKFKKKPVVVEAEQWLGTKQSWDRIMQLADIKWEPGEIGANTFFIETLEGRMKVSKNDWVIKGIKGEVYPCKPDIFDLTYEPDK